MDEFDLIALGCGIPFAILGGLFLLILGMGSGTPRECPHCHRRSADYVAACCGKWSCGECFLSSRCCLPKETEGGTDDD